MKTKPCQARLGLRRIWQHAHLVNVRFAPKATKVLRCRKASLCADFVEKVADGLPER
jgi:hypothetical protein